MKHLIDLKSKIENLEKCHHIDILRIIMKNNVIFSENRNGIFINMNNINTKGLKNIQEYINYIEKQEIILNDTETIKKTYKAEFFTKHSNESM